MSRAFQETKFDSEQESRTIPIGEDSETDALLSPSSPTCGSLDENSSPHPAATRDPLTLRAIVLGQIIGVAVAGMNMSFGLKTGWTQGGNVFAAVLSIGLFSAMRPTIPFTDQEANICQTTAAAAGSMASTAGLISAIPALKMLGHDYSTWTLMLWGFSVAFIGIFTVIPLRKHLIVQEKLTFPSGVATYETIVSLINARDQASSRARVLLIFAMLGGLFAFVAYFVPQIQDPPLLENIGLESVAAFGWSLTLDPLLIGGGMLSGPKTGTTLMITALIAWAIVAPMIFYETDWTSKSPSDILDVGTGVRGWLLWPGVALMVSDALSSLVLLLLSLNGLRAKLFSMIRACLFPCQRLLFPSSPYSPLPRMSNSSGIDLNSRSPSEEVLVDEHASYKLNYKLVILMGILSVSSTTISLSTLFGLIPWEPIVAIILSVLLAYIAVRCAGETDINPIGAMGKVSQLIFAALSPHQVVTNLMTAAVAAAGATQAGDLCQDLKTGYLLNTPPHKQFYAQMMGIPMGIVAAVPIYKIFDSAYKIGSDSAVSAPAAIAWKAVAEILSKGINTLPKNTEWGILVTLILGASLPWLNRALRDTRFGKSCPSGTTMGIALIVFANQSMTIFIGSMIYYVWEKKNPQQCSDLAYSVASGLVAGAGLMGVLNAILAIADVPHLDS